MIAAADFNIGDFAQGGAEPLCLFDKTQQCDQILGIVTISVCPAIGSRDTTCRSYNRMREVVTSAAFANSSTFSDRPLDLKLRFKPYIECEQKIRDRRYVRLNHLIAAVPDPDAAEWPAASTGRHRRPRHSFKPKQGVRDWLLD